MADCEDLFSSNLTASKTFVPKWKRKAMLKAESAREPLSPVTYNLQGVRTPRRNGGAAHCTHTKTPGKTPGKTDKTPKRPGTQRHDSAAYDRFIPNRCLMDKELSHQLLMKNEEENRENEDPGEGGEFPEKMKQNLASDMDQLGHRILAMKVKPPKTYEGELGAKMNYVKSTKPTPAKVKSARSIPSMPEKILDAPDILDDYYLNLLDWGRNGLIAVPLNKAVYLWNAASGDVEELFCEHARTPPGQEDLLASNGDGDAPAVTSVKWIEEGCILAVGLSSGVVELWDASTKKRVRTMLGHESRVGCLAWNQFILSSGSRTGAIYNSDVREANHHVATFAAHEQEVCGLAWNEEKTKLASGGNDNYLCIWDVNASTTGHHVETMALAGHTAAVKAVSWCPWQRNVVASGGGSTDRHVRIWNANTGTCIQSHDTGSQVSGILWAGNYHELVTSHGSQMTIWNYPSMTREAELQGHVGRILNIAMSPDGSLVASTGNDETLRLWRCCEVDKQKSKPVKKASDNMNTMHRQSTIR